jgi:uncharacterized protein (TIGR02246 family)
MKLILYALLTVLLCSSSKAVPVTQADKDSVTKVVLDFQEDFNSGSFKKAEIYATNDWVHINPGGGIDIGNQNVLQLVRDIHQTFLKDVTMTTDSMNVRFIKPEVAIVTAYHKVDPYTTPDSVTHTNVRAIKSYVIVKEEGKWLLTLDHNTTIQPIGL